MSWLKKLLGGGGETSAAQVEPVEYKGFRIYPAPEGVDGQYRIGARIELGSGGETRVHELIRADLLRDREDAVEASLRKARQVIDEQGEKIFR